jgi:hypothetical protein
MIGFGDLTLEGGDAVLTGGQSSSRSARQEDQLGSASKSLKSLIENVKSEAERSAIAAALEKTGWNRKAAAQLLRISYRTMLYKIDQYKMRLPERYSLPVRESGATRIGNGSLMERAQTSKPITTGRHDHGKEWTRVRNEETSSGELARRVQDLPDLSVRRKSPASKGVH